MRKVRLKRRSLIIASLFALIGIYLITTSSLYTEVQTESTSTETTSSQTKIDSTSFGQITVNGQTYTQDVIVMSDSRVEKTQTQIRHLISQKEFTQLMQENPDVIVIGLGQSSQMQISPDVISSADAAGIQLITKSTSAAITQFNKFIQQNKTVAAYMHVTC